MMSQSTSQQFIQTNPNNILITGSTGFIGTKLIQKFSERGYTVTGMSRREMDNQPGIKYVKADVFNPEELEKTMEGIEVAYYLLHSMEGDSKHWEEFAYSIWLCP